MYRDIFICFFYLFFFKTNRKHNILCFDAKNKPYIWVAKQGKFDIIKKTKEEYRLYNLIEEYMSAGSLIYYIVKALFLGFSWFVLFTFDLDKIDCNMFFTSIFIYTGSIAFDLIYLIWKSREPSKLVTVARWLSVLLLIPNIVITIISSCFSKWIDIVLVGEVYTFKVTMESFVAVFNMPPNLFLLKDFMIFLLIVGVGSVVPNIFVEIAAWLSLQQRKEKVDTGKGE